MNQIAIGDSTAWLVLDGESRVAPYQKAALFLSFSAAEFVKEKIEIQLSGTISEIQSVLEELGRLITRAQDYEQGTYSKPQYLRVQREAAGEYFYSPISNLYLGSNKDGYITRYRGSMIVELFYTRPNYFDGNQVQLKLTGRYGTDQDTMQIVNHTDDGTYDANTFYVDKKWTTDSDFPAPVRMKINFTNATGNLKDLFVGNFYHLSSYTEDTFFHHAYGFSTGSNTANAGAIGGYYKTVTWSGTTWATFGYKSLTASETKKLDGRFYRPIIHLYQSHAYTDLYFKIKIQRGSAVLYESEAVFSDPSYGYIVFPPVQIPPNKLLREVDPEPVDLYIYTQHDTSASYIIRWDQLLLLPLDYALFLKGFFNITQNDQIIYDQFRGLHNVIYNVTSGETIGHVAHGGPLLLHPNAYNRFIFLWADSNNTVNIGHSAEITLYWRKRVRII
ncbi:MAG: hypothetical protein ACK2TV_07100 [Anaerolineales bacterium]